jgi:hypothetical protein
MQVSPYTHLIAADQPVDEYLSHTARDRIRVQKEQCKCCSIPDMKQSLKVRSYRVCFISSAWSDFGNYRRFLEGR